MQALEMEEVESLVGTGSRKKLAANRSNQNKTNGSIASLAVGRNFMTRVIAVAGLVLLALLYITAKDAGEPSDIVTNAGDTISKASDLSSPTATPVVSLPAPVAAPTGTTTTSTYSENDEEPTKLANAPLESDTTTDNDKNDDDIANDNDDDISINEGVADEGGNDKDEGESGAKDYLYSNYATVQPLIDQLLPDKETVETLAQKWGKWHFWDGDEDMRPTEDYLSEYPNKDVPGEEFPEDAWQADAVFVNHYLNDADQLIARAMEAIFSEYGHGKPLEPEAMAERMKMFHWIKHDLSTEESAPQKYNRRGDRGNGGWTTERSFNGLVRRLLHAMMTSDTFTVVMGGHSAAAGQGNHFRQSYMMQFHKIMSPIFARLGVKLITRNMAQGGLGTVQASMGFSSIYGDEIDLIIWDSGMTENGVPSHVDLFLRQALISGKRVPVIWGGPMGAPYDLLRMLHEEADADVGELGLATDGIVVVESSEQAKTIPWAGRYMKCAEEANHLCEEEPRFCAKCWIERRDGIMPDTPQLENPKGQVKWHPGWRSHQLMGRNVAFGVLEALQAAINIWNEGVMGGPPLEDELWHVTDYYENIREKVKNLDKTLGHCYEENRWPSRICSTPMKGRTHYTPRANYHDTSIASIIKPTDDGYVPTNKKKPLYEGRDEPNPCLQIPEGEVDVFAIVAARRLEERAFLASSGSYSSDFFPPSVTFNRSLETDIVPGKGWELWAEPEGLCDGTYNAVCGLDTESDCALLGHHDERGAIIGNEYSGWLVMNLENLEEGIILIKLHTWHYPSENPLTEGWTTVNNERIRRGLRYADEAISEMENLEHPHHRYVESVQSGERLLMRSYDTPNLPEGFIFEYAINGKITTLDKEQFLAQKKQLQRVVETLTLLDDAGFTSEPTNVEVAVRLRGCGHECTFGVSHIYWA